MSERFYLYDQTSDTKTRFISFMGEEQRHDFALLYSDQYYGKTVVLDIQRNRFAIIGHDDLNEPGYIEYAFQVDEAVAEEMTDFLREVI
ncbi:DUF3055 domain-containing protein [Priestia taiwanensis]|uniref:DUF3055 domain-containing protein n=1 Tax=Priestia taiwanensis TaxID=1347902 RepID=A0A917AXH7_9BACI|nr:DUF3055 domain-containing protein [Priestia taiwanensis]MBM7364551.1 hypothetical protein [Priestia taiwanensis]GGE80650.1 hypothetical protein GCM10007140_32670 [Priestia taiwanensis]